MPISDELLNILCCPKNKTDLKRLTEQQIRKLNDLIAEKKISYADGEIITEPLSEGLITIDAKTVYRIDEDIPIMLIEKGIPIPSGMDL